MNNTLQKYSSSSSFKFFLDDYFCRDLINLTEKKYFPYIGDQKKHNLNVKFPEIKNPYFDNEIRGFIAHKIIDDHCLASTICSMLTSQLPWLTCVLNEYETYYQSLLEVPLDQLLFDVNIKLLENGLKTEYLEYYYTFQGKTQRKHLAGPLKFTKSVYFYILNYTFPDTRNEIEKDIWDLRKINVPVLQFEPRKSYTLNFSRIETPFLKENVKRYLLTKLYTKKVHTLCEMILSYQFFSRFLSLHHPEINNLSQISRNTIRSFLKYLSSFNYGPKYYNQIITHIDAFLEYGRLVDIPHFPDSKLFLRQDYRKTIKKEPRPFSSAELDQIMMHLDELPQYIQDIVIIARETGLRIGDITNAKTRNNGEFCIQIDSNGNKIFKFWMKTSRYHLIILTEKLSEIIYRNIDKSLKKYGKEGKYIFSRKPDQPYNAANVVKVLEQMSLRNHLTTDSGEQLHIKGHTFRKTKASELVQAGFSLIEIADLLGHKSLSNLSHYIKINSKDMQKQLEPITQDTAQMIDIGLGRNKKATQKKGKKLYRQLSNGICIKTNAVCQKAYSCFSCQMFIPEIEYKEDYQKTLKKIIENKKKALENGLTILYELEKKAEMDLQKIIKELENEEL